MHPKEEWRFIKYYGFCKEGKIVVFEWNLIIFREIKAFMKFGHLTIFHNSVWNVKARLMNAIIDVFLYSSKLSSALCYTMSIVI